MGSLFACMAQISPKSLCDVWNFIRFGLVASANMDTPSSYLPLILTTIGLAAVVVYSLSYYGRLKSQSWYVTVVSLIGWFSPFWIVFLLPLDLASVSSQVNLSNMKSLFHLMLALDSI